MFYTCFYCDNPIDPEVQGISFTIAPGNKPEFEFVPFHAFCNSKIIQNFIADTRRRDEWSKEMAELEKEKTT